MKKKNKKILIFLVVFIIVSISIITTSLYSPTKKTSYFYNDEFGLVKIEIKKSNFINSILGSFKQNIMPDVSTVDVNTRADLTDTHLVTSSEGAINKLRIDFNEPDSSGWQKTLGEVSFDDAPYYPGETITYHAYFHPSKVGIYTFRTVYWHLGRPGIYTTDVSTNELTVVEINIPSCDKQPYCEPTDCSYVKYQDIDGGYYEKQIYHAVESNCEYSTTTSYQTVCDDQHYITGTTSHVGEGEDECILIPSGLDCTIDGCDTEGQACNTASKTCQNTECSVDKTESCWDNSSIITKTCVITNGIGVFQDTTNTCPTQPSAKSEKFRLFNNTCTSIQLYPNETTSNDYSTMSACQAKFNMSNNTSNNGSTSNTTDTYTTCWIEKSLWKQAMNMSQAFIGNRTICDSKQFKNVAVCPAGWTASEQLCESSQPQKINWLLWGSIIGILILIIFIIGIYLYKYKR